VHLQREPDPQPAEVSGELRAQLAEVHQPRFRVPVGDVVGLDRVGAGQRLPVPDEECPGPVREEQPLVGVHRDGVASVQPRESLASVLGQREETAVGRVGVEPQVFSLAEVGECVEVVHGTRVGGSRSGHDEEGVLPCGPVRFDRGLEGVRPDTELVVGGDRPHGVRREPGQHGGLRDRVVGLVARVDDAVEEVLGEALAPSGRGGDEIGHRTAGREEAERAVGIPHHLAEPLDHVRLDSGEYGSSEPRPDVAIGGVREEVGHRRVEETTAGNVAHESRMGVVEGVRNGVLEQAVEEFVVRRRFGR